MKWKNAHKRKVQNVCCHLALNFTKILCVFIVVYIVYNYWYISEVTLTSSIINCHGCFKQDWEILLNNPNICKTTGYGNEQIQPIIIIFIPSSPTNEKTRNMIRQTWLSVSNKNTANIRYAFVLGTSSTSINSKVRREFQEHKDIVMFNFLDSYRNLTYKSIMGYKWAATFCSNVDFVMKADDDIYLNTQGLLRILSEYGSVLSNRVGGICNSNAKRMTYVSSKWFVSVQEYPYDRYPKYVKGPGYITKMNVAKKIINASKNIPYFYLEDVYIGLALKKLSMECKFIYGFFQEKDIKHTVCNLKHPDFVLIHNVGGAKLFHIWSTPCPIDFQAPHVMVNSMLYRVYHHIKVIIGTLF